MALKNTKFNPTSHTHSKSQITDFPTSLKNPNSISIKLNGGTATTYDGSAAKSINITPSSIGAAASSHSHDDRYYTETEMDSKLSGYLPLSGGTVKGKTTFKDVIDTVGIEIYHTKTPFIDFHYENDGTTDYTSRIIENAKGVLNINGATFSMGGSVWCPTLYVDNAINGNLNGYAKYLTLKGTNTYQGSDDNTGNWGNQGFSLHWYNANLLKHQPMMYMYVMNLTMGGSEVHQIACAQAGGSLYHRGGNTSGWNPEDGSWATILDDRNYKSICEFFPSTGGILYGGLETGSDIKCKTLTVTDRIEINNSYTPYIDFHYSNSTADYTSRIIENASGVLNINGATFTNGGIIWGKTISIDDVATFSPGIRSYNESLFSVSSMGDYVDPHPGKTCAIKASQEIAGTRFYKRGVSTTWISGAQPNGGCGFEVVYDPSRSDASENAFVPGYRLRNYSGAWVFGSYNQNRTAHIYYCDAARLTNGSNGTDADFIFNVNGNFAAKSVTQTSDETKKDIIYDNIPDSYKELFMNIKPFIFKWNDIKEDALHIGFGAQTTLQTAINAGIKEEEIGFIVKGGEDSQGVYTPWSANYTEFVPLTIAICQEQDKEIKALKAKNEEYERRISKLEEMIMATMA